MNKAVFFILHPSSFILHPSSFILHPSSLILHPSSFILHPSSFVSPTHSTHTNSTAGNSWPCRRDNPARRRAPSSHPAAPRAAAPALTGLPSRARAVAHATTV